MESDRTDRSAEMEEHLEQLDEDLEEAKAKAARQRKDAEPPGEEITGDWDAHPTGEGQN